MSVSEKLSGIVDAHVKAIESTAAAMNTFIFVRPTEFDSTILIKSGYATKSMDVHHKSSNWGPAAGFVPCDPAFSKKMEGKPNAQEHEHPHGEAVPIQLSLKNSILDNHTKISFKTEFELGRSPQAAKQGMPWIVKRKGSGASLSGVAAARAKFEDFQEPFPQHKFCVAEPGDLGNKSTLFVLTQTAGEWLVWWVDWKGDIGLPRPLRVFGYSQKGKVIPVTGDYDLWMVAPHFKHFDSANAVRIAEDGHGSSAASGFTLALNTQMNTACGRANNPVFNHGAEAQNYGFTQGLDANLAMFTPGGTSRMVRMNQMPAILGAMQRAGYLIVWNKRYGEVDPVLSGKADPRGKEKLSGIRNELETIYGELGNIRATANHSEIKSQFQTSVSQGAPKMPGIMKQELGLMAQRFGKTGELGGEQSKIYRFHRDLLNFLNSQTAKNSALTPGDFGSGYRMYEAQVLRLHNELQQALVATTIDKGQSSDQKLTEWLSTHKSQIDTLKRYWT